MICCVFVMTFQRGIILSDRSYLFSLVTYLTDDEIRQVLYAHQKSILHYAWILHDKDVNEIGEPLTPHRHLVLHLKSQSIPERIHNWFCYFDSNTFVEVGRSRPALGQYLIHENAESKVQYDISNVFSNDIDYWFQPDAEKKSYQICCDIMSGASTRELVQKYGREYIINQHAYRSICAQICSEELKTL